MFRFSSQSDFPKVFLHIGTNKTGTTSIQRYLFSNKELLKKDKLLYPNTGLIGEAHYGISNGLGFSNSILLNKSKQSLIQLKRDLHKEATKKKYKSVIISSEDFMLNGPSENIKRFLDGWEVKVIVYLRRHDEWWESAYTQAMKMKSNPPWPRGVMGFINYHREKHSFFGNYEALLSKWEDIVGRNNIIVRPFEKQQLKDGLLSDFLNCINYHPVSIDALKQIKNENESISRLGVGLLDVFQRLDIDNDVRKHLINYAISLPREDISLSIISSEKKRILLDYYKLQYLEIAEKYLERADGVMFYAPLPEDQASWEPVYCDSVTVGQHIVRALGHS